MTKPFSLYISVTVLSLILGLILGCATNTNAQQSNTAPVVTASVDCFGFLLDGSASNDPEGTELTYHWVIESVDPEWLRGQAVLVNENEAQARLCVANTPGSYAVILTTSDGEGETSDPVELVVNEP